MTNPFETPDPGEKTVCVVGKARLKLDEELRGYLDEALVPDSGKSTARIARVLKDLGYPIAPSTVDRHRNESCRCGR